MPGNGSQRVKVGGFPLAGCGGAPGLGSAEIHPTFSRCLRPEIHFLSGLRCASTYSPSVGSRAVSVCVFGRGCVWLEVPRTLGRACEKDLLRAVGLAQGGGCRGGPVGRTGLAAEPAF